MRAEPSFTDGFEGHIALRFIFSGCKRAINGSPCSGCHNPSLWVFEDASGWDELESKLKYWSSHGFSFDCISIVGGEPLDQPAEEINKVLDLARKYYKDLPVITYSGYTFIEASRLGFLNHPAITRANYVKFGPYIKELAPKGKLASSNQVMTKVVKIDKELEFVGIDF